MKSSLRIKLTLSYIFVVLVSFGFIAFYLSKNLEEGSLHDIKSFLINQSRLIEGQISVDGFKKKDQVYLEGFVRSAAEKTGLRLTIIDSEGKVLADSEKNREETLLMDNHAQRPEIKKAFSGEIGEYTRYSPTLKIDMLYVAVPLSRGSEISGAIRVAMPLENVRRTLFAIRKTVFIGLLFGLGLALVLGSILSASILKPVHKIIAASKRFAKSDFSRKVFHTSQDEIGELAATLNKMAGEIEEKIAQVSTQNQHLVTILSSMVEGVIVIHKSGKIAAINSAAEKLFNVPKNEAEGKLFLEAIRNNDVMEVFNKAMQTGGIVSEELSLVWPVHKILRVNASAIFENGQASGCLLVMHDISEIRRLETVRSDFVANVSHELKTPLTAIKGSVETLLGGALEDKENSRHFLEIVLEHTERLNNLINDLLELSHIESKETKLELSEIDLKSLSSKIISGFRNQAGKMRIEISNDLSEGLSVRADKDKIERVFINLIDNAIKFNKKNGILRLYAEITDKEIRVTVEDSGIGIPEKDIPRIFERFYRVDKARSRELGGTGLGLSIVKHIVELHGGSVGVESTEGLGSKFWFTLPK